MAFNGSSGSGSATNSSSGSGNGGNQDGPLNKRLCTGKENNEAGVNNNRGTQQNDELRRKRHEASRPNHILLFTIINPVYPITVEVLHTISSPHGPVQRIVIFKKNGVQAMVEFDTLDAAARARENLNGADIYSGCCTLKIDFAKPDKLNVYKNDSDTSWDYTLTAKEVSGNGRSPLLQDPLYGSRPQPYKPPLLGSGTPTFASYGPPEYHQSTSDVGASPGISAATSWKSSSSHQPGLIKEPQIAPVGRNGPTNFVSQGQQQGAVMMVYGLDNDTSNTDKLFNLVCLYGNVARIKFLKTKEGTAMVQMGDGVAVERCVQHLNNIPIGSTMGKLQIAFSKQNFLSEVTNPFSLPDHSPSFKEYTGSKNNRFLSPAQASKNRIQPPSKILHFFNTPPSLSEEQLVSIFNSKDVLPTAVRMFPLKTERSSSGLIEFPSVSESVTAIMKCNHIPVENKGTKFPFIMKLCFSSSKSMNNAWNMDNMDKLNEDN